MINGVKWHVTSFNLADYVFVEAVLADGSMRAITCCLVVDLPWPGVEVVRTPHYSHHIADEHPIVAFNDVRVPASHLVGAEGEPHDLHAGLVPVRADDGVRAMCRCGAAPGRRDDRVRADARWSTASRWASTSWWRACSADSATELFAARTMLYEVARSIDAGR